MRHPLDHLYRVRNGKFLGVCGGIARHLGINPDTFRIIYIIFTIFTGFGIGVGIYFILALVMKLEPESADPRYYTEKDSDFRNAARDFGDAAQRFAKTAGSWHNKSERRSYYENQTPNYAGERKAMVNDIITRSERLSKRIENLEQKVTKDDISWEERLGTKVS